MPRLDWDGPGDKIFELGVDRGVIYTLDSDGDYKNSEAWNGLTAVNESPSGAEETELWADNQKYGSLRSAEKYGATIECYTYPDLFEGCDGVASPTPGMRLKQQSRETFGLCYRTLLGNDEKGQNYGYVLHLVYGCTASPSEKNHETINDSPDAQPLSYEITTIPVNVGKINNIEYKPTSVIELDSTTITEAKMTAIEDILYGKDPVGSEAGLDARLPLPSEIYTLLTATT